jgi:hypothetical protein
VRGLAAFVDRCVLVSGALACGVFAGVRWCVLHLGRHKAGREVVKIVFKLRLFYALVRMRELRREC